MKLIVAILRPVDDSSAVRALLAKGYRVTRVATRGGFRRRGNVTLLIGVDDGQVQPAIDTLRAACSPARAGEFAVTLFVVDANVLERV